MSDSLGYDFASWREFHDAGLFTILNGAGLCNPEITIKFRYSDEGQDGKCLVEINNNGNEYNIDHILEKDKETDKYNIAGKITFIGINILLHAFGWCLAIIKNGDELYVMPSRTMYRGFKSLSQDDIDGYVKLSKYMIENGQKLLEEAES